MVVIHTYTDGSLIFERGPASAVMQNGAVCKCLPYTFMMDLRPAVITIYLWYANILHDKTAKSSSLRLTCLRFLYVILICSTVSIYVNVQEPHTAVRIVIENFQQFDFLPSSLIIIIIDTLPLEFATV